MLHRTGRPRNAAAECGRVLANVREGEFGWDSPVSAVEREAVAGHILSRLAASLACSFIHFSALAAPGIAMPPSPSAPPKTAAKGAWLPARASLRAGATPDREPEVSSAPLNCGTEPATIASAMLFGGAAGPLGWAVTGRRRLVADAGLEHGGVRCVSRQIADCACGQGRCPDAVSCEVGETFEPTRAPPCVPLPGTPLAGAKKPHMLHV